MLLAVKDQGSLRLGCDTRSDQRSVLGPVPFDYMEGFRLWTFHWTVWREVEAFDLEVKHAYHSLSS